jgi:hypothetical protein
MSAAFVEQKIAEKMIGIDRAEEKINIIQISLASLLRLQDAKDSLDTLVDLSNLPVMSSGEIS